MGDNNKPSQISNNNRNEDNNHNVQPASVEKPLASASVSVMTPQNGPVPAANGNGHAHGQNIKPGPSPAVAPSPLPAAPQNTKKVLFKVDPVVEGSTDTATVVYTSDQSDMSAPPEPQSTCVTLPSSSNIDAKDSSSEDEDDNENKTLEDSPCGRFSKKNKQVKQRDVPGIDVAYLAMDTEEGKEVVWNEVQFSERKNFRAQEEKIKSIFDNLTQLHHTNLVAFHKYWTDNRSEKPRVIFITESMSDGAMSLFMKRTRKGSKTLSPKVWKKWCTQILSAVCYLHSCDPPIVHGNLSCNTIFIQTNGLIKIGCVAPKTIHHHVKTFRDNIKNMHCIAPEYASGTTVTPAADIYAFGVCVLEGHDTPVTPNTPITPLSARSDAGATGTGATSASTASLSSTTSAAQHTTSSTSIVTHEMIINTLNSIENPLMQDFITRCLRPDPLERPTARELMFHSVLFEVHSLLLLAAHRIVDSKVYDSESSVSQDKPVLDKDTLYATCGQNVFKCGDIKTFDADKFLEDVRNGSYPLTAFATSIKTPESTSQFVAAASDKNKQPIDAKQSNSLEQHNKDQSKQPNSVNGTNGNENSVPDRALSPATDKTDGDSTQSTNTTTNQTLKSSVSSAGLQQQTGECELRRVTKMQAELRMHENTAWSITLLLKLEDQMNRQLTADITDLDTPTQLANELVMHGFINELDFGGVSSLITQTLDARAQHNELDPEMENRKAQAVVGEEGEGAKRLSPMGHMPGTDPNEGRPPQLLIIAKNTNNNIGPDNSIILVNGSQEKTRTSGDDKKQNK